MYHHLFLHTLHKISKYRPFIFLHSIVFHCFKKCLNTIIDKFTIKFRPIKYFYFDCDGFFQNLNCVSVMSTNISTRYFPLNKKSDAKPEHDKKYDFYFHIPTISYFYK